MKKGIYCYLDKKNDKTVYVGKDSNIDKNKRHRDHLAPSNYNRQPINRVLQNNPDRYIYQVLWEVDDCTDNHLNQMEIFYIKKYDPKFNFTEGGNGLSGFKHSEESRKKMSKSTKGKNNPMYGKTGENSPRYGKTHSAETRKKMSNAQKGKTLSEGHKKKISETNKGKIHSEETKRKLSKIHNTSGFYRISKKKDNNCKQNFFWRYSYYINNKRKDIESTNLLKLKEKVEAQGLPWEIIDEEKAKKTLQENNNRFN